jgi:ABC-2 type transport system ATP-binding protein
MDEPTNGFDIPSKSWFRKLISMAVNEQRTILISTHQVRDLENLIDSVVIIEEGKVLLQHSIQAISEKLVFKTGNEIELSEADLLFSEKALLGYSTVSINNRKEESKVNLEHLFEACMQSSEKILSIFQNPS